MEFIESEIKSIIGEDYELDLWEDESLAAQAQARQDIEAEFGEEEYAEAGSTEDIRSMLKNLERISTGKGAKKGLKKAKSLAPAYYGESEEADVDVKYSQEFTLQDDQDTPLVFSIAEYRENDRMAVDIVEAETGELCCGISTNLPNLPDPEAGWFYVKTWSENEDIVRELFERKILLLKKIHGDIVVGKINPQYLL